MKPLLLIVLCAALTACHGLSGHTYIPLTATSFYNADSVRLAFDGGDEKAADKKLRQALDRFKKNKDTLGSIPLFKDAILLKPTAQGYFELSGPLLAAGWYEEAVKALGVAEKLGYAPLANVMFRYAYAYSGRCSGYSNTANGDTAVHYMELAIQMGYAHPQQFLSKELFHNIMANYNFDAAYTAALAGSTGSNLEKTIWESYPSLFPAITLPLIVNKQWISDHVPQDEISFQYERFSPDMRDAKFSREGGTLFYYAGMLRKDPAYTAVLYSMTDMEDEDTTATPVFVLTTYQPGGKIIDRMNVAGQHDLTAPFRLFTIQPDLHFQVQDFSPAADSTRNIGGTQPINYLIDANGKFVRTDAPLASR